MKKIDVSFSSVCPVCDHEFRHNIVKVTVDPQDDSRVDPQKNTYCKLRFVETLGFSYRLFLQVVSHAVRLMESSDIVWAHLHEVEMFSRDLGAAGECFLHF